jgi:hypothetical protein
MKNSVSLEESLEYLGEGEPNYGLKTTKVRGGKSPKIEGIRCRDPKIALGAPWSRKRWRGE